MLTFLCVTTCLQFCLEEVLNRYISVVYHLKTDSPGSRLPFVSRLTCTDGDILSATGNCVGTAGASVSFYGQSKSLSLIKYQSHALKLTINKGSSFVGTTSALATFPTSTSLLQCVGNADFLLHLTFDKNIMNMVILGRFQK